VLFCVLTQKLQVDAAIFIRIKNTLAIISALRDVVRQTGRDHSSHSGHLDDRWLRRPVVRRNRDSRSPSLGPGSGPGPGSWVLGPPGSL